jgi:hypothetical protein
LDAGERRSGGGDCPGRSGVVPSAEKERTSPLIPLPIGCGEGILGPVPSAQRGEGETIRRPGGTISFACTIRKEAAVEPGTLQGA